VVEWGRLLSGYRGEILGRRFESCPPRHFKNAFREGRVFVFNSNGINDSSRSLRVSKSGGFGLLGYFKLNFIPKCDPLNPSLS
jgi:hypothetical protein